MAEKTTEEWWPERLKILELQYENSKLRVFENGSRCKKWKKEIDLLINNERLHTESLRYEKLSRTYREQERLLKDQIKSLEKELKESKAILCQTTKSLEDVKEKSKAEKERLQERLTSEAEERHAKQQEEFEKERDTLNKEVDKWKNVKEKLKVEMKEMEKALRQEAEEEVQRRKEEAKTEIEYLDEELHMWKDKCAKVLQEIDGLQKESADKNASKATKATQTQNKMANKAVMVKVDCATIGIQTEMPAKCDREVVQTQNKMANKAVMVGVDCATIGIQAEIPTECGSREQVGCTQKKVEKCITVCLEAGLPAEWDIKQCKMLPKKEARGVRNSVHLSHEKAKSVDQTSVCENSKQLDKQLEKDTHDRREETNGGTTKAKQKRTGNSRQSIHDKQKKTSNDKDEAGDEECSDVATGSPGNVSTGTKSTSRTAASENSSNGKVRKRKCNKESCKKDETNAKKTKKSSKNKGSLEDKVGDEKRVLQDDDQQKKDASFHTDDKQRKTSEQTDKENILKDDKNGSAKGKRPGTAFGISKPSNQPSLGDRTRQLSVAEMSSILNGTKRQRTLLNPKDSSLMVSFLPVQESFMNSTMSRGNKPNGTIPPSLSSFMRSFIAPKLKKKST